MYDPIPILVIIAFSIWWQVMTGMVIFSIICVLGFGIAVIVAEEAE